jgi:hypothetical protein
MGGIKWQHKPENPISPRDWKKTGRKGELLIQRRNPTLYRDGRWFSHGLTEYKLWWEFLVRAEQAPDIKVNWKEYEGWGNPKDYQTIDVWSSKSRDKGWWKFWKTYGIELFAENDDEVVKVHRSSKNIKVGKDKFLLEIPTGTKPEHLMKIIKRVVEENTKATNISHISTARFPITKTDKKSNVVRANIRKDAFRRWVKIWDMKQDGSSASEIDNIHGINDDQRTTYRNLWKAKTMVMNVANGEFPGDTLKRKW